MINTFDPIVVTITKIRAGTTDNVIPETVFILGTIRAVSEHTRSLVHDELRRVAEGVAHAHGATSAVEIEAGYPVTINDKDVASFASGVARDLLGDDHVQHRSDVDRGRVIVRRLRLYQSLAIDALHNLPPKT